MQRASSLLLLFLFACGARSSLDVPGGEPMCSDKGGNGGTGGGKVQLPPPPSPPDAGLPPGVVEPLVDCVLPLDGAHSVVVFGYRNATSTKVSLPIGPFNTVLLFPTAWSQPEVFEPGEVHDVFGVTSPKGDPVVWLLSGHYGRVTAATPICSTGCAMPCPAGTLCAEGACITVCGDGLCAGTEGPASCAADCACPAGNVSFADGCANPAECGVDWNCGSGLSFGVYVDCGACPEGSTCVNHACH